MFRNHRIPLTIVLAVLAIVGADIRTANAQNPGFRKFFRERMVPEIEKFRAVLKKLGPESKESGFELRGFVDWFWRKRVRAEESVREAPKDLVRKLGEVTPSDRLYLSRVRLEGRSNPLYSNIRCSSNIGRSSIIGRSWSILSLKMLGRKSSLSY
jgi:hypothetical protein